MCPFIFWHTYDLIIFNKFFLNYNETKHFFYLAPILTGLFLTFTQKIFIHKTNSFFKILLSTLINMYIIVSLLFLVANYCDADKNLTATNKLILIIFLVIAILFNLKILYQKFNKEDLILLIITTIIVISELYFILFTYNLFYRI